MTPIVIRIPQRGLGWNCALEHDFWLGLHPGGGYGVIWNDGAAGLGRTSYGLHWEPPFAPVRIDYRGQAYIFCRDDAADELVQTAPFAEFELWYEGR